MKNWACRPVWHSAFIIHPSFSSRCSTSVSTLCTPQTRLFWNNTTFTFHYYYFETIWHLHFILTTSKQYDIYISFSLLRNNTTFTFHSCYFETIRHLHTLLQINCNFFKILSFFVLYKRLSHYHYVWKVNWCMWLWVLGEKFCNICCSIL